MQSSYVRLRPCKSSGAASIGTKGVRSHFDQYPVISLKRKGKNEAIRHMATNGTTCSHYKSSQFWHVFLFCVGGNFLSRFPSASQAQADGARPDVLATGVDVSRTKRCPTPLASEYYPARSFIALMLLASVP
jgi:hypothetical protein